MSGFAERWPHEEPSAQPRSAENTVHDLIAVANDLRRHITEDLRRRGYDSLRPTFGPLLARIWHEAIPQGRLADELGVSVQAASQTITLAEAAGYVTREPNPSDGRSKLVVISDAGRRFVEHGVEAIETRAAHYTEVLGARRLERFESALARVRVALGISADVHFVSTIESRRSVGSVVLIAERARRELHAAMVDAGHGALRGAHNAILVHVGPLGARASDIARTQRVSRQGVTAMLHEIEALGYVRRRNDDDDARGVVFALTRRGHALIEDYVRQIDLIEERYEEILGPDRFTQFAGAAHDLGHRVRLESAIEASQSPATAGGRRPRAESELADLADDLVRWLGGADAARLGGLLGERAADASRQSRAPRPRRRRAG